MSLMHVLLLDDDAFLRDMYATKFTELGHTVEAADSAENALALLTSAATTFDVALLDLVMPGMGGLEFMRTAKEQHPDKVRIYIVLSNQGEEQDKAMAKEAGASGYVVKAESIPSDVVKQVELLATTPNQTAS